MDNKTLLYANMKRHRGTMCAIFLIMLIVSLTLISVVTIWSNATTYLEQEMERMHYGDITAWTQNVENQEQLQYEIEQVKDVHKVFVQSLIYSDYQINDTTSDSEGQLIVYEPKQFPYRFFNKENTAYIKSPSEIRPGDIYIPASLASSSNLHPSDTISFLLGRQDNLKTFRVRGTFEDPFMGSSMIGMKGFLISQEDYETMYQTIEQLEIDSKARMGQMYHIEQSDESTLNAAQFNQLLHEKTSLGKYTEFVHSKHAIMGFMLVLQNAFTGLFSAFAFLLLIVAIIIIGYSINASVEQDYKNMAILKTIGYEGRQLRRLLRYQYLFVIIVGALSGIVLSTLSVPIISSKMVSFAGILTPATSHMWIWIIFLLTCILVFSVYLHLKTRKISKIVPVAILQNAMDQKRSFTGNSFNIIRKEGLIFRISLRQLLNGKKRYISVLMTSILLVFFTSMIGRMNTWLGVDGKGMMDAFNPSDLDIGIQLLGNHDVEEMEHLVAKYTDITDSYALAMPGVAIDGVDVTANVITEPERFHIQKGRTIQAADEIVITETIAADQNLHLHDAITITHNGKESLYHIVGIYQCANDMGSNIGMSREGFLRIGTETKEMWCHHYFLEDTTQKQKIIDEVQTMYGGDVYIHENTWPGLISIIAAMHTLLIVMYVVTAFFILIVTVMTGNKLFLYEKRNFAIYKSFGFYTRQLRMTFAIRYALVAMIGSIIGILLSATLTDSIVGTLMKLYGISNFASHLTIMEMISPAIIITLMFACFAYLPARSIKKLDINELISE